MKRIFFVSLYALIISFIVGCTENKPAEKDVSESRKTSDLTKTRSGVIDENTDLESKLLNYEVKVIELKDKIVAAWQKDVYSNAQVQLHVTNIASFSQLNTLKNSLKYYIRGIQAVHQRSFAGGSAIFDIDIKGTAEQMASELDAKEIEGMNLQVTGLTQNKVSIKIVQPGEK